MKMLQLAADGDSIVLGSTISLLKVVHSAGTEYYMAAPPDAGLLGRGVPPADVGCWTLLANGNGVVPVTVGKAIGENVENEIRMALRAGLESMGVDTKGMLKGAHYPQPPPGGAAINNTKTTNTAKKGLLYSSGVGSSNNKLAPVGRPLVANNNNVVNKGVGVGVGCVVNNKCLNDLNLNNKLDVIAENENNQKMVSTY